MAHCNNSSRSRRPRCWASNRHLRKQAPRPGFPAARPDESEEAWSSTTAGPREETSPLHPATDRRGGVAGSMHNACRNRSILLGRVGGSGETQHLRGRHSAPLPPPCLPSPHSVPAPAPSRLASAFAPPIDPADPSDVVRRSLPPTTALSPRVPPPGHPAKTPIPGPPRSNAPPPPDRRRPTHALPPVIQRHVALLCPPSPSPVAPQALQRLFQTPVHLFPTPCHVPPARMPQPGYRCRRLWPLRHWVKFSRWTWSSSSRRLCNCSDYHIDPARPSSWPCPGSRSTVRIRCGRRAVAGAGPPSPANHSSSSRQLVPIDLVHAVIDA